MSEAENTRRRQNVSHPFEDLETTPPPRSQTTRPQTREEAIFEQRRQAAPDSVVFDPSRKPAVEIPQAEEAEVETVEWRPAIRDDSPRVSAVYREALSAIETPIQEDFPAGVIIEPEDAAEDVEEAAWEPAAQLRSQGRVADEDEAAPVAEVIAEVPAPVEEAAVAAAPDDAPELPAEEIVDPQLVDDDDLADEGPDSFEVENDIEFAPVEADHQQTDGEVIADLLDEDERQVEPGQVAVVSSRRALAEGEPYLPFGNFQDSNMKTFINHTLTGMSQVKGRPGRKALISFYCQPIKTSVFKKNSKAWVAQYKKGTVSTDKKKPTVSFVGWRGKAMVLSFLAFAFAYLTKASGDALLVSGGLGILFALPMAYSLFYAINTGQRLGGGAKPEKKDSSDDKPSDEEKAENKDVETLAKAKRQASRFFNVTLDTTAFSLVDEDEAEDEQDVLNEIVASLSGDIESTIEANEHNYLSWEDTTKIDGGIDVLQVSPPDNDRPLVMSSKELAAMVKVPDESLRRVTGVKISFSNIKPLYPHNQPHIVDDPLRPQHDLVPIGRATTDPSGAAIGIPNSALNRHFFQMGRSGTGKSVAMTYHVLGVSKTGYPIVVLDPHGQTIDQILRAIIAYHPERLSDVVLIDIEDASHPPALNPLAIQSMDQVPGAVNSAMKLMESHAGFTDKNAPQAVQYGRMILESYATVNVLLYQHFQKKYPDDPQRAEADYRSSLLTPLQVDEFLFDPEFRTPIVELAHAHGVPNILSYFENPDNNSGGGSFVKATPQDQLKIALPIQRFFAGLRNDEGFARALAMDNRLDFAELISEGKIILCRLGLRGSGANLGQILASMILNQILSTMDIWGQNEDALTGETSGRGLRLFIDEFPPISKGNETLLGYILAEARKYGFGLFAYGQFLNQIEADLRAELEENASCKITLKQGPKGAKVMAENIGDEVTDKDVKNLPLYTGYANVLVDENAGTESGPFTLSLLPPMPAVKDPALVPDMPDQLEQILLQSRKEVANEVSIVDQRLDSLRASSYLPIVEMFNDWLEEERQGEPAYHKDMSATLPEQIEGQGTDWNSSREQPRSGPLSEEVFQALIDSRADDASD